MSGNIAGGRKAAKTNKKKFGDDFYQRIGAKGGRNGSGGGFGQGEEGRKRASIYGAIGGKKSRRKPGA